MEKETTMETKLNDLPKVIKWPGEYRTRGGKRVTIHTLATENPGTTSFAAKGSIWRMFRGKERPKDHGIWHTSGRFYPTKESPNDIIDAWGEKNYLIRAVDPNPDEYTPLWSNEMGWVEGCSGDETTFTQSDRDTMNLPMGGEWVEIPA